MTLPFPFPPFPGVLNSGVDIVIELSRQYIERIIRSIASPYRICITKDDYLLGPPIDGRYPVRDVMINITNVTLRELRESGGTVRIVVELTAISGQVNTDPPPAEPYWQDIIAGQVEELEIPVTSSIEDTDGDGRVEVVLTFDTSRLRELEVDIADEKVSIPLDFLDRRRDGLTLLAATPQNRALKVVDGGHLAIGIDVRLSQDEPPGSAYLGFDEPYYPCGLPAQPPADLDRFRVFTQSFLDHDSDTDDFGIAFDAHIVDALIRSLDLNRVPYQERGLQISQIPREAFFCPQLGASRFMCVRLHSLQDGRMVITGNGQVYACPDSWLASDGFYSINFDADVTLSAGGGIGRQYRITRIDLSDAIADCFAEASDYVSEAERRDTFLFPVNFDLGDSRRLGTLSLRNAQITRTGFILTGRSDLRVPYPGFGTGFFLNTPVLFATNCDGSSSPIENRIFINSGSDPLHICAVMIAGPDAERFSIVSPPELLSDGGGVTISTGAAREVILRLDAAIGELYTADLRFPTNIGIRTVQLRGDFRPASATREPNELRLSSTQYRPLCNPVWPELYPLFGDIRLRNEGPGHLHVCSIELDPDLGAVFSAGIDDLMVNADGELVRQATPNSGIYQAGETAIIRVFFTPVEVNRTFETTMRIMTNAGDADAFNVHLVGRLDRSDDFDSFGLIGSFAQGAFAGDPALAESFFCGQADWEIIRGFGGLRLPLDEFMDILGGEECCPPPRQPACQCLDFLLVSLKDVPRGIGLSIKGQDGRAVATLNSRFSTRVLIAPINVDQGYELVAKIPGKANLSKISPLTIRRWLVQQDSVYETQQRLNEFAVYKDHAYAAGPEGIEVIRLSNVKTPQRIGLFQTGVQAITVAVFGAHLLAGGQNLEIYSLQDTKKPNLISRVDYIKGVRTIITTENGGKPLKQVWVAANALYGLDVSDPKQPKQVAKISTRIQTNRGIIRNQLVYLCGKGGLEIFDISNPTQTRKVGSFATDDEVRNAILFDPVILLINDSRNIEILDISVPTRPRHAGNLSLEDWVEDNVPIAGRQVKYRDAFLILKGDQMGLRLMRARPNRVDEEKLLERRKQVQR